MATLTQEQINSVMVKVTAYREAQAAADLSLKGYTTANVQASNARSEWEVQLTGSADQAALTPLLQLLVDRSIDGNAQTQDATIKASEAGQAKYALDLAIAAITNPPQP